MKRWKVDLSVIVEANPTDNIGESLIDVVAGAPAVQDVAVTNVEAVGPREA